MTTTESEPGAVDDRTDDRADEMTGETTDAVVDLTDPTLQDTQAVDMVRLDEADLPWLEIDVPLEYDEAPASPDADTDAALASEAGATDPRFEERIATVESERRDRRRRWLWMIATIALIGVAGAIAVYSPFLDVDRINIIGSTRLTPADLAARTGVRVGSPMVFVDPGQIEATLRKDPHFVRVAVTRQFPSRLSIRLTDRQPIARVVGPSLGVIVGEDGIVMDVARGNEFMRTINIDRNPPTRPGARLPARLGAAVDVAGSMGLELAVKIRTISITPTGELVFDLAAGGKVLFGTVDEADRKLRTTRTMLGGQVDIRNLCQLDVRVPSAPTMRRNPDCAPPPPLPSTPTGATPSTPTTAVPTTAVPTTTVAPRTTN